MEINENLVHFFIFPPGKGGIFGASLYVTMFIAGTCMIIAPFKPASRPLIRDMVVYLCQDLKKNFLLFNHERNFLSETELFYQNYKF